MSVSLDDIADLFTNWCQKDFVQLRDYYAQKGGWKQSAQKEFSLFVVPNKSGIEVKTNQPIYTTSEEADWVFTSNQTANQPDIIAELTCESLETYNQFEMEIESKIEKLKANNLKEEYKKATKCIITLYFDVEKREYLHSRNFIEIFNNFEIGCAILRIK